MVAHRQAPDNAGEMAVLALVPLDRGSDRRSKRDSERVSSGVTVLNERPGDPAAVGESSTAAGYQRFFH